MAFASLIGARFERVLDQGVRAMARSNSLYLIIGALVVVVVGLGAYVVREETKPKGVEMSISSNGVKVEQN